MLPEYLSDHNRLLDTVTGNEEDLLNKIKEGEHQTQDFKFRIDSSQKIAKTLSAFANTDGGSLLIGVKDNYVPPSSDKPHKAKEANAKWLAYVRQRDENFLANKVLLTYMSTKRMEPRKNLVEYGKNEKLLFEYLIQHGDISLSKLVKYAGISVLKAERMLVLFLKWEVIGWRATENGIRFYLID